MFGKTFRCLGFLILVVLLAMGISCSAQPVSAPYVITAPGMYELSADARGITDVYGIRIEASDVVLDGQGHFLGGDQRENSVGIYVNKYGGSITNVTIKNVKLEDWNTGISYQYVKGKEGDTNEISNMDILDCPTGIHVEYSDIISITDNLIRDCSKAINIEQNSRGVLVKKNNLKDNGVGVIVMKTSDVTLTENTISTCDVYGVQVTDSSGCTLTKNGISDNKYAALQIENSVDSTIVDNNFSKTTTGPVVVIGNGVQGAKIYNNYFGSVNNISVDDISSDIVWNTTLEEGVNILGGPYKGGNYWGSAPGLEGFSDTVPDEDGYGIGDKPYEINAYNIDYLPLTHTEKNAPAPTPQPTQSIAASELRDINLTETNVTHEENTVSDEASGSDAGQTEALSEDKANNTSVNETEMSALESGSSIPNISVQNEYAHEDSIFSALGSDIIKVKDENGTVLVNTSAQISTPQNSTVVKNGYLLFTGLTPGEQVVLITSTLQEVLLDHVMTSNLSVPVPPEPQLYTSWKVMNGNVSRCQGTIERYPAADETVVIAISQGDGAGQEITSVGTRSVQKEGDLPSLSSSPSIMTSNITDSQIVLQNGAGDLVPGYTITAYAGPGGAIFPEGTVEVMKGENVTFVLTPYEGHQIAYLLIDGSNITPVSEYQFVNVTRDHTIIAGFI